MEYTDLQEKDNASLMAFVKEARVLMNGAVEAETYINTTDFWALFQKTRVAEELMKFRNLPLDEPKLGPKFGLPEFRDHVFVVTENEDQKTD